MCDHGTGQGQPVIVALPPVVDSNSRHAYDRLHAAVESGTPVVIADFTDTVYCDATAVHGLLMLRDRAAVGDVQFRLVIPPGAINALARGLTHSTAGYFARNVSSAW
jgi:anti-anti-sigma regulatory factor